MIRTQGGTEEEYQYWMQYYNMYSSAIKITQQAYQPNAQRKREYLRIYEDVRKRMKCWCITLSVCSTKAR